MTNEELRQLQTYLQYRYDKRGYDGYLKIREGVVENILRLIEEAMKRRQTKEKA